VSVFFSSKKNKQSADQGLTINKEDLLVQDSEVKRPEGTPLSGIKNIVAIGSGKGGVGKSTVAAHLASTYAHYGYKVGLVDADVYGPSIPYLLGANENPKQVDGKIIPPIVHGIKVMSMGILGGDSPVIWRGPIASRAVHQFMSQVSWGELDFLFIDLPPGTGDIQLTMSQSVKLDGAIIVMTPQGLAQHVALKGLKMFEQLRVPLVGIIENMSGYNCSHCGEPNDIFHKGGGQKLADELELPLLAKLPIDSSLVKAADDGKSVNQLGGKSFHPYQLLAKNFAREMNVLKKGERKTTIKVVKLEPNYKSKMFKIHWSDEKQSLAGFKQLRFLCPCAECVDEATGKRIIKMESVADDIAPNNIVTVGNYAYNISWTDGHKSGIYSFDYLRKKLVKA